MANGIINTLQRNYYDSTSLIVKCHCKKKNEPSGQQLGIVVKRSNIPATRIALQR